MMTLPEPKCPACAGACTYVSTQYTNINSSAGSAAGVIYSCPHCGCILSVGPDAAALRVAVVDAVAAELRKHRP